MVDSHQYYLLLRAETPSTTGREVTGELAGGLSRARERLLAGGFRLARALLARRAARTTMDPAGELRY